MDLQLNDKIALVTGGSGIGRAIAEALAREGAKVIVTGRHEDALQETANAVGENCSYVVADVTKAEDIDRTIEAVQERFGRLDILVNNAGWSPIGYIEEVELATYDKCFDVNVRGVVALTKAALPLLKESKGNIVNISSTAIRNHLICMSVYSAAKAAVDMFTKIWSKEFAPYGIRINSVSPGSIDTPIYDKLGIVGDEKQAHMDRVSAGIPMKRFGVPDEVASVVTFLASNAAASYVTGSDYCVDGGYGV